MSLATYFANDEKSNEQAIVHMEDQQRCGFQSKNWSNALADANVTCTMLFFAAAAEAMRRILVDNAHHKKSFKRGGDRKRVELSDVNPATRQREENLIALDEALNRLAEMEPRTAELVKLRYFAGFTNKQAAELLEISPRTGDSLWAYAKVWLHEHIAGEKFSE